MDPYRRNKSAVVDELKDLIPDLYLISLTEELTEHAVRVIPVVERDPDEYMVSFMAVLGGESIHSPESVGRIFEIADEISVPYEVVIGYTEEDHRAREMMRNLKREFTQLRAVRLDENSAGSCKRQLSETCYGKFLVIFNLDYIYDYSHADLIFKFLGFREKKMLFSELPVIPASLLSDVGNWRDLKAGEDVDLFCRIAIMSGLTAYPRCELEDTECVKSGEKPAQKKLAQRIRSNYTTIRDLMIGCNYSVRDMMLFNMGRGAFRSIMLRIFFTSCLVGTRFSKTKPLRYDKSNYLIFIESVIESLVIRDYLRFDRPDDRISLGLTKDEINYLGVRSRIWEQVKGSLSQYIRVDGGTS